MVSRLLGVCGRDGAGGGGRGLAHGMHREGKAAVQCPVLLLSSFLGLVVLVAASLALAWCRCCAVVAGVVDAVGVDASSCS